MRVVTLSRADLGKRHVRLDPAFYLGRELVRSTMSSEGSRHVSLEDIVESIHDGARLPSAASGIPMLRLNNVRPCELDLSSMAHVDGTAAKWINVQRNDVLFTRAAQPFRAAAVQSGMPAELAVSSELTIIRPRPAVLPEYLAAVFCTPTLNRILRDLAYRGGSSALPRLRLSDIARLPIPLPSRSLQESLGLQYQQAVDLTASARAEFNAVVTAIHTEVDHRVSGVKPPSSAIEVLRSQLAERWDVPFNRGRVFRHSSAASSAVRPLLQLAKPAGTSLRGLADDEKVFAVQADDVNEHTFLVEGGEVRPLSDLSSRMRQRLEVGDVLLCTTGSGDQVAYLDEELGPEEQPLLGSATFTALRFHETPRVFAVALAHPLVRMQLRLLSSGSMQRFVNKRDLDELLVPVLGQVWREDFETRLTRAMQRRREALLARTALIEAADDYLRKATA
ncbi:restriction endonuclease subunit S [Amycolatopsis keratiniphila]|uniref:Type I restriction enzyme, S subunit n=1 Tax=Amycolatopsis keratiniphila subsp. keratiniphila TaxID=227715 RepID=A0A1W2LHC5_9PSEU|nr:hypothetical protein [Amycolatopsis keratiniphila]ONF62213.1 hypothetical protein AVR91_0238230 [Amycolatopsis keratiniphila subsp. keratiniphila]